MKVRSGMAAPTVTRSRPRISVGVHLAERALIDAGGIDEAVADHPFAGLQRRPDGVAHVIVARGREQDRLGLRARAAWRCRTTGCGG